MQRQITTLLIALVCFLSVIGNGFLSSMSETQRHILSIVSLTASVLLMLNATYSLVKTMKEKKK